MVEGHQRRSRFGNEADESRCVCADFWVPVKYSGGELREAVGYVGLEL